MNGKKITGFISTFILCFMAWLLFTLSFNVQEIIAGLLASFAVALISSRFFIHQEPFYLFNPLKLVWLILYLPIFFKELIKANVDVARRSLSPSLPLNPGIVKVPTELSSEYGLAMLCNSITLTPGTISMDVVEEDDGKNYIYIHWIDVQSKDPVIAGSNIKGSLESGIMRVWR